LPCWHWSRRFLAEWLWIGSFPFLSAFQSSEQPRSIPASTRPAGQRTASQPVAVSRSGTTLLRELPRQALLITAAQEFALPACDRSVDFAGTTADAPLTCTVSFKPGAATTGVVEVVGRDGKKLQSIDLPVPARARQYPDYANVVATVEPWCDGPFATLLSTATGQQPKRKEDAGNTDVPGDVESLLSQIDPQRAFLAAHRLHESIAQSGESPERLAALVRAYSHLGESTRYLYSRHGSAFFARAMIYAERFQRKYPNLALSHAARGYAYALLGEPMEARRSFDEARKLAAAAATAAGSSEVPAWAALADDLARFRTRELFDRVDGGPAPALASYFALLTVEHSGLQSVVINMSRLALKYNPGALRVITIMTDNSGGSLHETTGAQFELLASLASDKSVPADLQAAAGAAQQQQFAAPALLALFDVMDQEPAAPGQLLPWGAYASISRDALLVAAVRRLYFTSQSQANPASASRQVQSWWPILKDHRFAAVIGGFDRTGKLSGKDAVDKARGLDLLALYGRMTWMCDFVKNRKSADGKPAVAWIENYEFTSDGTAYDLAHLLWSYRVKEADAMPVVSVSKAGVSKSLEQMCPDHPSAVSEAIVNRWPETRAKAAEIERDMGTHPQIAYALARAYRFDKRYDDAERLLGSVIEISPDPGVYEELAEIYKDRGNVDKWLEVYNQYLSNSEDFGLSHARKNEEIAYTLMRMKRYDRALEYAKKSAESGSGWGYIVYASCLTELGHYEEAEKVQKVNQERYPESLAWYRWCQTTGKGDLNAAKAASQATANEIKDDRRQGRTNEAPMFFILEGDATAARAVWQRDFDKDQDPYPAMQLAMIDVADGKTQSATEILDSARTVEEHLPPQLTKMMGGVTRGEDPSRTKIYRAAIQELQRCLADPAALPKRDGEGDLRLISQPQGGMYAGNAAYFFGRLCEVRGKKDDAAWWYRTSLDCGAWNFACRPQSGAGLRRLGQEYYK
jgi:tetratricopeptide (TPR) repeat protein